MKNKNGFGIIQVIMFILVVGIILALFIPNIIREYETKKTTTIQQDFFPINTVENDRPIVKDGDYFLEKATTYFNTSGDKYSEVATVYFLRDIRNELSELNKTLKERTRNETN